MFFSDHCGSHSFLCRGSDVCINSTYQCDDIVHCPLGDDEKFCFEKVSYPLCKFELLTTECVPYVSTETEDREFLESYLPSKSVRYLDISDNMLSRVSLFSLYYLYLVNASCNVIKSSQLQVSSLINLRILDISHNHLTIISKENFNNLLSLKRLILRDNPIEMVINEMKLFESGPVIDIQINTVTCCVMSKLLYDSCSQFWSSKLSSCHKTIRSDVRITLLIFGGLGLFTNLVGMLIDCRRHKTERLHLAITINFHIANMVRCVYAFLLVMATEKYNSSASSYTEAVRTGQWLQSTLCKSLPFLFLFNNNYFCVALPFISFVNFVLIFQQDKTKQTFWSKLSPLNTIPVFSILSMLVAALFFVVYRQKRNEGMDELCSPLRLVLSDSLAHQTETTKQPSAGLSAYLATVIVGFNLTSLIICAVFAIFGFVSHMRMAKDLVLEAKKSERPFWDDSDELTEYSSMSTSIVLVNAFPCLLIGSTG